MKEVISVVVPVYNAEKYLAKCVESILAQTYQNLEIILVDDGSTDSSPKMCDDYASKDKRIKVVHKENGGASSARNAGLDVATGHFVAFVDSDDYIEKNMYELLLSKQREGNYDLVFCRYNEDRFGTMIHYYEKHLLDFCQSGSLEYFFYKGKVKDGSPIVNCHSVNVCICRVLFGRQAINSIRFDENIKYISEDMVFMLSILSQKNMRYGLVDEYLYNYVCNNSSTTHAAPKPFVPNAIVVADRLGKVLTKEDLEKYYSAYLMNLYCDAFMLKYHFGTNDDLSKIKLWANKQNYKKSKKFNKTFFQKFKAYLAYHNMVRTTKLLYKIKG